MKLWEDVHVLDCWDCCGNLFFIYICVCTVWLSDIGEKHRWILEWCLDWPVGRAKFSSL